MMAGIYYIFVLSIAHRKRKEKYIDLWPIYVIKFSIFTTLEHAEP